MKYFSHVIVGAVCVAIVAGFFIVGSPLNTRTARFDERRVSDLQNIQWQIVNYWQRKSQLPASLDNLKDDIAGYRAPVDPKTSAPYAYEKTGNLSFKLCAAFETKSSALSGPQGEPPVKPAPVVGSGTDTWTHEAGTACFDRTIDPELYKPLR